MGIFNRFLSGYDSPAVVDERNADLKQVVQAMVVSPQENLQNISAAHDKAELSRLSALLQQAEAALAESKSKSEQALQHSAKVEVENTRLKQQLDQQSLQEKIFAQAISETLGIAASGELDRRVDISRFQGAYTNIGNDLNKLLKSLDEMVGEFATSLNALASGKLTARISRDCAGSFGILQAAINTTIDKLLSIVSEIQGCTQEVKSGAVEINANNTNLSSRTEQQATSLEETSAAMEQITTTVQQNAANAVQANNLARAARETAENGGHVVSKAVAAMQAISDSSSKINEIIGVIDEIAFQTNLLALNAAVEAARAGDQGRGFAVVADEVRNLAGRSAKAAKEIKDLIKDSGEKVREGANLVNKSGLTLNEIVTAVKKVNDIVAEIATASDEQATGLDEINRAVSEMDAMTQQNAAMVEHASNAGRSLDEQASRLESLLHFFETGKVLSRHVQNSSGMHANAFASGLSRQVKHERTPAAKPASKVRTPARNVGKAALRIDASSGQRVNTDSHWSEF